MNKLAAVLIGAAVGLGLLGAPAPAAAQVEITYATFLDPSNETDPRVGAQARMIKEFERQNPNVKVKILVDPVAANLLRAMKTGSDTPDVGRVTSYSFPEMITTGNVKPLDDVIARENIDPTDWLLPLDASKINGRLYGMPQDFRIPVLMYRKSILNAAGVQPPSTWAEACTAGAKAASPTVIGFAIPLGKSGGVGGAQSLGEYVSSTMLAPDGKYFSPDGRNIAFSKETFVRFAQTIKDMYGKCKATSSNSVQFGYNEIHDGLRAGTVAMSNFGLARFGAIRRQGAGDDLGWAPAPSYTPNDKQTVFGFQIFQNAKTKNPDAAWAFIKFMTSTQGQAIQAEGGEVVARASAYKEAYFSKPESENQKQWAKLISARGQTVSYSPILTTFHEIMGDALQRMVLRDGTPEAAYQEVVTKYNEALAKASKS
jgi:ABC-type glycerol-3-phosphate transport system substrate-binding protein